MVGGTGQDASLYVPVVGSTGSINANSIKIVDQGSVYSVGDVLDVSGPSGITPTIYAKAEVLEINNNVGDALEIRGFNTTEMDGVYKIISVPSAKSIQIYVPSGVPSYQSNTNGKIPLAMLSSKGVGINSFRFDNVNTGIVTVTTEIAHGLLRGNKFTIVGSGHTIYDKTFVVKENVGLTTFTFNVGIVTQTKISTTGTLLKHSLSANELVLTRGEDNLGSRASYFYAGITTTISASISASDLTVTLTSSKGFERGDYIAINNEIIRLSNSTSTNTFNVLRGRFSTFKTTAEAGTQVKKISVMPMEVRRPSFMRASGHTFEYLGYGPGNYSTGMPQKQTRILTEDDVLVSQARKQKGGVVVYTGMNDVGEFYSGAKKLSSSTGEEKIVEAPIISYTGDDAEGTNTNKLDVTFDNVLARGRIIIEGGEGARETSQFYGPVSFSKKVVSTSDEGIISKNLYISGDTSSNKLITVGLSTPTSANLVNSGNISLKSLPNDGYIGQVYIDNEWKKFGLISQSKDILDLKVDRIGIGNSNLFLNAADSGVNNAIFYVGGKAKFRDVVFSGNVDIESGVTLDNVTFNDINIRKTAFFSGVGGGGTSYAIYVYDPGTVINSQSVPRLRSRFYDLEVAGVSTFTSGLVGIGTTTFTGTSNQLLQVDGGAYFSGSVGIGITNPSEKLVSFGDVGIHTSLNLYSPTQQKRASLQAVEATQKYKSGLVINVPDGDEIAISDGETTNVVITGSGSVGVGTTNLSSKLQVHGTIGISSSGDTEQIVSGGRTKLSSNSTTGFIINQTDSNDIILQNQGTERLRVGAARTATYTSNSNDNDLKGSHFKLKNTGTGDVILSWFADDASNQRWYSGIDVSDSYSWKLASPNSSIALGQENFDSVGGNSARNQIETKLRVNSDGDLSVLGSLTLRGLNTPPRLEVNSVGVTTIKGSLNLFNLTNTSGSTLTVSDITVNTDRFVVAGNTGNITTKGTIVSDGELTVNSSGQSIFGGSLGVTGAISAGSFVKTNGGSLGGVSNILRADGTDTKLFTQDIINALGFIPQQPIEITDLPTGNSLLLKDIGQFINGTNKTFQLFTDEPTPQEFKPLGPYNLIVSLGGVIQKPFTDYIIQQVNGSYTNIIEFIEAPPSGIPCFIIALGGQGSLIANQDWNAAGELLVGTGDNQATKLSIGTNNQVLTVDTTTGGSGPLGKLKWAIASTTDGTSLDTVKTTANNAVTAASAAQSTANNALAGITPVGGIIMWSGTATPYNAQTNPNGIPTGWALCDGGTYNSRVTPDLRNRFVIGSSQDSGGQSQTTITGVNTKTGGTKDSVVVSHSHGITDPGHTHTITATLRQGSSQQGGGDREVSENQTLTTDPNTTGISINPEGESGTNQNLPPYFALAFIMRVS